MDKHQLQIFSEAFKKATFNTMSLPNNMDISKVYDIEIYPNGMRNSYSVRFRILRAETGDYTMELVYRDDYTSWHRSIDHNGNITDLENYKGQYGRVSYPDDPERTAREHKEIQDHNDALHKLLMARRLEENTDDPEFETNNVIKIRDYGF